MSGEDLADDRQAQPHAASLLTPGDPVEFLEDARQVLASDPFARILDAESDEVAFRLHLDPDRPPARSVLDRVDDQVVEDMLDPIAIDHDAGELAVDVGLERDRGILGARLHPRSGAMDELVGEDRLEVELDPALLDPGQVEQVVDHREDAIGILPRRQEQLDLFGRERAHDLLEEEVDGHLHAGERGLQLMADGRNHVALQAIEQMELGHVQEGDRGADELIGCRPDRHDTRQEIAFLAAIRERDRLLERVGEVIAPAGEDFGDQGFQRRDRIPGDGGLRRRDDAEQPARRRIGLLDRAGQVDDHDGVGK